ncbi:MAG: hypothetical protein CR997_06155 [Acidobacteria bacterium]|nr:MAG: hypothetical protein CR997_06155 [Acidobacteriota bacterium]
MKLTLLLLTSFLVQTAFGQDDTIQFYNGQIYHNLHVSGSRYDLFVDFCEFTEALGRDCQQQESQITIVIKGRTLLVDLKKKTAVVNGKTIPLRLQTSENRIFMSVRSLIRIYQPLLSRKLIYEPTSRVLHLAKKKTVSVSMGTGIDGNSFYLQVKHDKLSSKPALQFTDSYLILSFKTPYLRLDTSGVEFSEAILNVNLFDHLPDGTSEIHIELGKNVSSHRVDPYTADSGFIVVRFFGKFKAIKRGDSMTGESDAFGIHRIVIDPGHGGKDEGARGPTGLKEKHVTLLLCRALKRALESHGFDVLLTRESDYHLPLKVRTGFANNEKADLFLSIHLNAIPKPNAWGSETFYLSLNDDISTVDSYTIAFENRDLEEEKVEDIPSEEDLDLNLILWDLAQTEFLEDSFRVARYVQEELNILAGTKNRGVKQAPLKVLQGAQMPACLIEVAFISNPREEEKLRTPIFKSRVVKALTTAIRRYDRDVKERNRGKAPSQQGRQP